ncbi:MAG: FAD-dependent oxidoreductase [Lentisphaeria bacterium]
MKYQVIIAGFGTAGAIAAIAAARQGVKVLVLERNTCPGGIQADGFIYGYYLQNPMSLTAEINALIEQQRNNGRLGRQPVENRRETLENLALQATYRTCRQVGWRQVYTPIFFCSGFSRNNGNLSAKNCFLMSSSLWFCTVNETSTGG